MDGFQKVLFGVVFWTLLGSALLAFGIYAAIKFADWLRVVAVVIAFAGGIVLAGTFANALKLFEPCYAWWK